MAAPLLTDRSRSQDAADPSLREGLLASSSPREKERRSSFESEDGSDIDATEFLTSADPQTTTSPTHPTPAFLRPDGRRSLRPWQRCCAGRSRCCLLILSFGLLAWILLGAGGVFVYKKYQESPPYGLSPPWYPSPLGGTALSWAASYQKASAMVSRMTLAEKVNVTTGVGWEMGPAVGSTGPAVHVGFPQLHLQDGPLGIRFSDNTTAFPAGITVGATWNRQLMFLRGKAHGNEARRKGINVLLGPCVGPLGRMPAGGRNWEGFGADPYLQGIAGAETIKGIQSEGVMATIKHFVGNEQEHFRQAWEWGLPHAISSNIDDRTLHELYAWPFGDAVKAGVASVMCSYNMVNSSYACSNSKLLNGILKDELGFQGFVMSDWLAQRAGVASALAGLDMTMPGDGLGWADGKSLWGPELTKSIYNGSVPLDRLNDMVTRIVAAWYQLGQDNPLRFDGKGPNFSSWTDEKMGVTSPGSKTEQEVVEVNQFVNVQGTHWAVARQVAVEGTVLLKNEDVLPISPQGWTDAKRDLRRRHSGKLSIGIFGEDGGAGGNDGPNSCKDRGCNKGTLGSGWGSGAVEFPHLITPIDALRKGFNSSRVEIKDYTSSNMPPFITDKGAAGTDVCIVFANADSGEGFVKSDGISGDRNDLLLQKGGEELVRSVAKHCGGGKGQTVVVIHAVGPVLVERWIDMPTVKAVLLANLPGQESGNALADVIFGLENPSGHLPYTMGKSLEDYGPGAKVMYLPNGVVPQQDFKEGLFIDYRHFDKHGIEPRFEFGYGLSYTTFSFSNLTVKPLVSKKTAFPSPRSETPRVKPPSYSTDIPDESEAVWPDHSVLRPLEKYVYPYIDGVEELVPGPYPYPDGYFTPPPKSGAGGEEGGHPELWETLVTVRADVTNTGARDGQVVAQLYMSYPNMDSTFSSYHDDDEDEDNEHENKHKTKNEDKREVVSDGSEDDQPKPEKKPKKVEFPVRVLRGFDKFAIPKGATVACEFNLTRRDLSYWDVEAQNWRVLTDGQYGFAVGLSSRDLTVMGRW